MGVKVTRSCITTAAVILLVLCVYVNLHYLPIISQHKTGQQQDVFAKDVVTPKLHEPIRPSHETKQHFDNPKEIIKPQQPDKIDSEIILEEKDDDVPETILGTPTPGDEIVDPNKIVSALIEVC